MATDILGQNFTAINPPIDYHDTFLSSLSKSQAMVDVALSDHFLATPPETAHSYLWILSDLLTEARELGEELIMQSVCLQKKLRQCGKNS